MLKFTTENQVETYLELEGYDFQKSNFYCPIRKVKETRWHVVLNGSYREVSNIIDWANSLFLRSPSGMDF